MKTKLVQYESMDRQWFALCANGELTRLGDCGDIGAADQIATDLGLEAIWLADYETAKQWLGVLKILEGVI